MVLGKPNFVTKQESEEQQESVFVEEAAFEACHCGLPVDTFSGNLVTGL